MIRTDQFDRLMRALELQNIGGPGQLKVFWSIIDCIMISVAASNIFAVVAEW